MHHQGRQSGHQRQDDHCPMKSKAIDAEVQKLLADIVARKLVNAELEQAIEAMEAKNAEIAAKLLADEPIETLLPFDPCDTSLVIEPLIDDGIATANVLFDEFIGLVEDEHNCDQTVVAFHF
jgi:hypothetical protein